MPNRRTLLASVTLAPVFGTPLGATRRAAAQEASPSAMVDITEETDVSYGEAEGEALLLDVYRPPTRETPRPAVILIHGGAWTLGVADRSYLAEAARKLAEAGYVAFNITYRLMDGKPEHNVWPDQLDDVQRAVRWVRANAATYGVDPERIASYGHSAGGHLAAMLGVRDTRDNADADLAAYSSRVDCVVDLSGDLDLTAPQTDYAFKLMLADFLGGTAAEAPEAYRDASPITWIDAEAAPFLNVHGGQEDLIIVEQSQQMAAALYGAGAEVVYVALPRFGHMGTAQWSVTGPITLAFLEMQVHPAR